MNGRNFCPFGFRGRRKKKIIFHQIFFGVCNIYNKLLLLSIKTSNHIATCIVLSKSILLVGRR